MKHKCKKTDIKTTEKCELNREQIINDLEGIASKANCNYMRYLEGCGCFCIRLGKNVNDMAKGRSPKCNENCEHFAPPYIEKALRSALALIKELTEENERLQTSCTELTQCCTKLDTLYKIECKRVDTIKADTVRKMQKRLHEKTFEINDANEDIFLAVEVEDIDQIAEEMLEENENDQR